MSHGRRIQRLEDGRGSDGTRQAFLVQSALLFRSVRHREPCACVCLDAAVRVLAGMNGINDLVCSVVAGFLWSRGDVRLRCRHQAAKYGLARFSFRTRLGYRDSLNCRKVCSKCGIQ
jgi:hypothetical protein